MIGVQVDEGRQDRVGTPPGVLPRRWLRVSAMR